MSLVPANDSFFPFALIMKSPQIFYFLSCYLYHNIANIGLNLIVVLSNMISRVMIQTYKITNVIVNARRLVQASLTH